MIQFSGHLMDFVANAVGVPLIPSYVPRMSSYFIRKFNNNLAVMLDKLDEMTFPERAMSLFMHVIAQKFWPR